jgi:hypothetical protein
MDIVVWTGGILAGSPTFHAVVIMSGGILAGGSFVEIP